MTETWKPVPEVAEYEVSDLGNFRRTNTGRPIAVTVSKRFGYGYVRLSAGGRAKNYRAHRLVLRAFVGEPPHGCEARHLNGQRMDNRVANLAWGTAKANKADQVEHGNAYSHYRENRGEKHPNAKLSDDDVRKVRALHERGWSQKSLAAIFACSPSNISRIVAGVTRL